MKVFLRHIDADRPVHFTDIHFNELEELIAFIRYSGGFRVEGVEEEAPFHSYELVLAEDNAYAEILLGATEE